MEVEDMRSDRDRWKAAADKLAKALLAVEWIEDIPDFPDLDDDDAERVCPFCDQPEGHGHNDGCPIADALVEYHAAEAEVSPHEC